jgi:hypothetical protein
METTRFIQEKKTFSMLCRVEIDIPAEAKIIWAILTDAKGFPRWNSTVNGIDGYIREGERIRIHVPGTNRTFRPKVLDVVANKRMTWSNGLALIFKGSRRFELKTYGDGSTEFIMEEKFSGLIFAIVKVMLPEFRPIFETYACDLKRESERVAHEFLIEPLRLVGEH